jgi:hypothetical protein
MAYPVAESGAAPEPWSGRAVKPVNSTRDAFCFARCQIEIHSMKCFKRIIRDWFVVVPVCLLFAAIFAQTGSYWQGFCILAALFGIIVIYAVDNLGHAVKRSWLEKADLGNGPWYDTTRSLDCYPDESPASGSSTNGDEQNQHVQESFGGFQQRRC